MTDPLDRELLRARHHHYAERLMPEDSAYGASPKASASAPEPGVDGSDRTENTSEESA